MDDRDHYVRVAIRLRRWGLLGTWRRMVKASKAPRGASVPVGAPAQRRPLNRGPVAVAAVRPQPQYLSRNTATNSPRR